jgi:hypothetical protein
MYTFMKGGLMMRKLPEERGRELQPKPKSLFVCLFVQGLGFDVSREAHSLFA